jgi:outer membrane protein assembly factor BamB
MEFLMRGLRLSILPLIALLALAGCASSNLSRKTELNSPPSKYVTSGVETSSSSTDTFDGHLDLLYEKKIKGSVDGPLQASGGVVVFKSTHDRVLAYERASGKRVAQIKKRHGIVLNSVIGDSLLVIVRKAPYGEINIINLYNGHEIGKRTIRNIRSGPILVADEFVAGTTAGLSAFTFPTLDTLWSVKSKELVDVSPVSDGSVIYYCDGDGMIRAVKAISGESIWDAQFDYSIVSDLSVGAYLYFGLADGSMNAIDKSTGSVVWQQSIGFQVHGRVAETESRIFFGGTDGAVYCLSKSTGEVVWSYQTEGIVTATPVIYNGAVLVGSYDRHFYSLNRDTGELIDRKRLEGPVTLPAQVGQGLILVADRKERLYCFKG